MDVYKCVTPTLKPKNLRQEGLMAKRMAGTVVAARERADPVPIESDRQRPAARNLLAVDRHRHERPAVGGRRIVRAGGAGTTGDGKCGESDR